MKPDEFSGHLLHCFPLFVGTNDSEYFCDYSKSALDVRVFIIFLVRPLVAIFFQFAAAVLEGLAKSVQMFRVQNVSHISRLFQFVAGDFFQVGPETFSKAPPCSGEKAVGKHPRLMGPCSWRCQVINIQAGNFLGNAQLLPSGEVRFNRRLTTVG